MKAAFVKDSVAPVASAHVALKSQTVTEQTRLEKVQPFVVNAAQLHSDSLTNVPLREPEQGVVSQKRPGPPIVMLAL